MRQPGAAGAAGGAGRLPAPATRELERADLGLYAVVVLVWGTSWIALKMQLGLVAPEVSLFWRFLAAAALMFVWVVASGRRMRFPWRTHLRFAALGVTLFSLNFTLFYYGAEPIPSGLLSVLFSLASALNILLSALLFGERPRPVVVAGALTGAAGVALMFWPEIFSEGLVRAALVGVGLCLAGTLTFCLGNMVSAANQRAGIPVVSANAWGMAYGALFVGVAALIRGAPFVIEPTLEYLGSLVWLAVSASVVAFAAYLTLLGRIGAARTGYATVMFPVVALMISTLFEGYSWTPVAAAGLALALAGNVLVLGRWGAARAPQGG